MLLNLLLEYEIVNGYKLCWIELPLYKNDRMIDNHR